MGRNNGSAFYVLQSTTTPAAGLWFLVGTSDGTTRRIYLNGRLENSTTNNANPLASGASLNNTSDTDRCPILFGAAWRRTLTDGEIWQMYQPRLRWSMLQPGPGRLIPANALTVPPADSCMPQVNQPHPERIGIMGYE